MATTTTLELEREEVERILHAGLFAKAPRLERFFTYICERYFEGAGDQIKECSIAIEALGRSTDFDPKKDSIVRVEAHRLRKRLEEYYRGPGVEHHVRVCIPNGQYRPQFIVGETPHGTADGLIKCEPVTLADVPVSAPPTIMPAAEKQGWLQPALLIAGCCSVGLFLLFTHSRGKASLSPAVGEVWTITKGQLQIPSEFRMLAGYHGLPLLDRQQHLWIADAFYTGGRSTTIPQLPPIEDQAESHITRAQRSGQFNYDIPLRQATYELHLFLTETEFGHGNPKGGGEGTRVFQVSINGAVELGLFDVLASAGGPNRIYERVFKNVTPQSDGKLHLAFAPVTGPAFLNALEILPTLPDRIHPVRIVAQENPVTDSDGRLWAADEYFSGGTSVLRTNAIANSREALYQGERFGNFSYRIPLAPGKYRLTLHFAETWFGTAQSNQPALDNRVFNVFANGVALLRNYEIARDAGGPNRRICKVFESLEPNAQGMLVLEFLPVKNYAEVNAIEVVETG